MRTNRQIGNAEELRIRLVLDNEGEHSFSTLPTGDPSRDQRLRDTYVCVWAKTHPAHGFSVFRIAVENE
jgi:hypothetical protein